MRAKKFKRVKRKKIVWKFLLCYCSSLVYTVVLLIVVVVVVIRWTADVSFQVGFFIFVSCSIFLSLVFIFLFVRCCCCCCCCYVVAAYDFFTRSKSLDHLQWNALTLIFVCAFANACSKSKINVVLLFFFVASSHHRTIVECAHTACIVVCVMHCELHRIASNVLLWWISYRFYCILFGIIPLRQDGGNKLTQHYKFE